MRIEDSRRKFISCYFWLWHHSPSCGYKDHGYWGFFAVRHQAEVTLNTSTCTWLSSSQNQQRSIYFFFLEQFIDTLPVAESLPVCS
jgi:hypothetical protein